MWSIVLSSLVCSRGMARMLRLAPLSSETTKFLITTPTKSSKEVVVSPEISWRFWLCNTSPCVVLLEWNTAFMVVDFGGGGRGLSRAMEIEGGLCGGWIDVEIDSLKIRDVKSASGEKEIWIRVWEMIEKNRLSWREELFSSGFGLLWWARMAQPYFVRGGQATLICEGKSGWASKEWADLTSVLSPPLMVRLNFNSFGRAARLET